MNINANCTLCDSGVSAVTPVHRLAQSEDAAGCCMYTFNQRLNPLNPTYQPDPASGLVVLPLKLFG